MRALVLLSLMMGCFLFEDKEEEVADTACFEDDMIDIFYDNDGDGYGEDSSVRQACVPPESFVTIGGDCGDFNADIHPGAEEIPYDGIDNDCSGADLNDVDGDGFLGLEGGGADCDDTDDAVYPNAEEVCDGVDNDCDELIDDEDRDVVDAGVWFTDADGDGYGDPETGAAACEAPSGAVSDDQDCDDTDGDVHPGAEEVCDGVDSDCDPKTTEKDCT